MQSTESPERQALLDLRPAIPAIDPALPSHPAEQFQNETLRPILKMQNDLLVAAYRQYAADRKSVLFDLPQAQQPAYIAESLKKDQRLRSLMLGMIMGLFSLSEYQQYLADKRELSKRAISMLITRLQDQILG
jgi:hypothetical protein